MGSTRRIRRGDIWDVNLDPTIGHEIKKIRPALIIQNDIGNDHSPLTIVAPLTSSHVERIYPTDVFVDAKSSGLSADSKILLNQIRAIDKKRLIRKCGSMRHMEEVDDAIRISLGLIPI